MRDLSPAYLAALDATNIRPVVIVRMGTATAPPAGDVRMWSGTGTLSWDSGEGQGTQDFTGVGTFGGFSTISETNDLKANGVSLSLSGVPSELISIALGQIRYNRPVRVWVGLVDTTTLALINSPELIFGGYTDNAQISDEGESATITIQAENRLVDLERPRHRRYTTEDQKIEYPNDKGFDFVPSLQDKQITWGRGIG